MNNKELGTIKRKINNSLKKAGFIKEHEIGTIMVAPFGYTKTTNGDYIMANKTGTGGIIFIPEFKYEIKEILNKNENSTSKGTTIYNYLGDSNKEAITEYIKLNQNEIINNIYNHLLSDGFGQYMALIDGPYSKNIIIQEA